MGKIKRTGKIFIDYLRNGRTATAIAPFSTRSRPRASVSVPLAWEELTPQIRSDEFTARNLREQLARLKRIPRDKSGDIRPSLAGAAHKNPGV